MQWIQLNDDTKSLNQSYETVIPIEGKDRAVRIELRLLKATNKWYYSMYDSVTGEPFFTFVPVVACWEDLDDLIAPFYYKGTGFAVCASLVDEPSSVSPEEKNMNEFVLIWGDSLVE